MTLQIKNMVCPRCITAVTDVLRQCGLHPAEVVLGQARLEEREVPHAVMQQLVGALSRIGFELILSRDEAMLARAKQTMIDLVQHDRTPEGPLSAALAAALRTDYESLSRLFSQAEGRTLEKYFIALRLERVKALLQEGQLSIKEIAWRTGFSGVPHLSRQFKQLTGITPTLYRERRPADRIPLDRI